MIPFDPMEIALHAAYSKIMKSDERLQYTMAHEYPLEGKPPMMTHLFKRTSGELLVAAKGAPEAIMSVCKLSEDEKLKITNAISELTKEGYRILGVSEASFAGAAFPEKQQDFDFQFIGIVAFYDPPKKNIDTVLQDFYAAGIAVKIITGDNEETTKAIAKQVGFKNFDKQISGEDLMKLSDADLQKTVRDTHLFTRMFPEAKLKIINALKAQNEIVAMTGDGVNDAPALKAAHIGIAMGKKGTEIAKQASSLILLEDDLSKMVIAIAMGRKIYSNLKKAIQYIISIHIPIIFTVFIPLALGWKFPSIFSPIHIIFLELIMGPTCSIIYENEPMEKNAMLQKPRLLSATFFSWKELAASIVQGLVITIATLSVYVGCVAHQMSEEGTRTMIFCTLVAANIFLTLENRSAYYSCFTTLKYKNNLVGIIILITVAVTALLLLINPLSRFFQFEHLSALQLIISIAAAFVAVFWLEVVKAFKRSK
jgi:Ca2+-transporting ATPase